MMEFVNGKDDIPYMKWKIRIIFQTTNQDRDRDRTWMFGPGFPAVFLR
jgi:hypothetical protein